MQINDSKLNGLKILVTGAGGPAGYSLLERLSRSLPNAVLHAADMSPLASGLYSVLPDRRHLLPSGSDEHFALVARGICRLHHIDLLIPTVDCELEALAEAREELRESGVRVAVPSRTCLATCLDKYALTVALDGTVPIPKTTLWKGGPFDTSHRFPLVAKPRSSSGGRGVMMIDSPSELRSLPTDGSYMLCEYLPGAEYSVDVFRSREGRVLAAVPRERMRVDSGVAITARTVHDETLERLAAAAVDRIDLHGTANVQLRRDVTGIPRLLEINPRFPGTMALTVAAGVDIPTLAVLDAMNLPLPSSPLPFEDVAIVRQWTERVIDPRELERMGVSPAGATGRLAQAS